MLENIFYKIDIFSLSLIGKLNNSWFVSVFACNGKSLVSSVRNSRADKTLSFGRHCSVLRQ